MTRHDCIIVGGGHNGLVAACYLAKAGLKTLVLERREIVGGTVVTEEIYPGFRCSTVLHSAGPFSRRISDDLNLKAHGLEEFFPPVRVTALDPNGGALSIYDEPRRTADELHRRSTSDADRYEEFASTFDRIGRVLRPLLSMTPPAINNPHPSELWRLSKLGMSFRGLGKKDEYRLLRYGPMAVADLVGEWFEDELLRSTIAARGIFGQFAGPWSAGTSTGILWQSAIDGHATAATSFFKGGMGGLTQALAGAAKAAGAEIRTGVEVKQIINDGQGVKVILASGDEINAGVVVSNADPKTAFLKLVDPVDLEPTFLMKIKNLRATGSAAKINLALSALPSFKGVTDTSQLSGRIHVGPEIDYLEKAFDAAKYGDYSPHPYMDITIPTLTDSSLAPAGAHVMSIHVQFAPFKLKEGDWQTRAGEFADNALNVLSEYAPDLKQLILARRVITPDDLEQTYGLSGGHLFQGEQSLDQSFMFRPLIGWAQYRTPIKGLYLCGSGTHPGGGVTGSPGANAAREVIKDFKTGKA